MSIKGPQLPLSPLLFGALLALYSCGSSPSADEAPPAELVVEAPPVVEAAPVIDPEPGLDRQLAEMQAALEGGLVPEETLAMEVPVTEEPIEEPIEELTEVAPQTAVELVASEVEGLFLDPGEVFPVEIMDGVPGQVAMLVDEPELDAAEDSEEEPFELVVDASEALAVETVPAEELEDEQRIGLDGFTAEDLQAMTDAFGDPGMLPAEEPVVVATEAPEDLLADAEAADSERTDELVESVALMDTAVPMETSELEELAEALSSTVSEELVAYPMPDELLEGSELAEAPEPTEPFELIDFNDFSEFEELAAASELAEGFVPAESPDDHEALAVEPSELAQAEPGEVPDKGSRVVPEPLVPEKLVWQIVVPEPVHIDLVTAADSDQGVDVSVDVGVEPQPDAQAEPADEVAVGPTALEIETVVETPVATALEPSAPSPFAQLMAFTQDLDPAQRLWVGPLVLADPSGGLARLTLGLQSFATTSAQLAEGPPEDPSLVGLTRSSGKEFDPVPIEQAKLTGDPDLGMIWWSGDVPTEQVDSAVEIQTPSVGRVRVVLNSGDYVEGLMHSVGMGQYWIDGDLGRFAVRAGLVAHIEHLPKPGLGVETKGMQAGDLVRAKAKSGFIEGRLVSMKDGKALIETANGMRISLPDAEVEPLGSSKTRVVID